MTKPTPWLLLAIISSISILTGMRATAAEIRINGIPLDKKDELVAQVSHRLDFIKTREASSWRADDAAFFFERLLIRAGHVEAKVDWKLPGGNIIELNARPGVRYRYGKITANQLGPLTDELLRDYFLQPIVETESVPEDKAPYIEEYTQKGITNVENYLKSLGYWQAKVSLANEDYNRNRRRINIHLKLAEGNLFQLAPPSFKGASEEDIREITPQISDLIGQTAISQNLSDINSIVEKHYRKKGYHFAQISVEPKHSANLTTLIFNITPGLRYKVDDISIRGDDKTKSKRIRRYFDNLRDKYYDENSADEAVTNLLSSGAFRSAKLTTHPSPDGTLDLQIDVTETDARSIQTYAGFGTFEEFILGASYTDLNFRGELLKFNARGEFSGRGFLGDISLSEPHFAGEPIQLTLRAFLLQRSLEGYDKTEGGIESSFTYKYLDHYTSRFYLGASQVGLSTTSLNDSELGPDDYLNARLGFEQTIDFRDDKILPSKGFYAKGSFELGNVSGDASTTYQEASFEASYRFTLGENNFFVTRFSTGAIFAEDQESLPIDLRLFSGGPDSVRSFEQRELGPRSLSDDPLGGEAHWNASIEYIRPINDPIKGVIFLDAGQVYSDVSDWGSFSDPSYAIGLGLRIDLPIGPVRLEYGYNLNRRDDEPSGAVHFSIGTSF